MRTLNKRAWELLWQFSQDAEELHCRVHTRSCGALVVDAGVQVPGGVQAGLRMIDLCAAGLISSQVLPGKVGGRFWQHVVAQSDWPFVGCFLSQSANWPVDVPGGRGMGSGPACLLADKSRFRTEFNFADSADCAVLVLEADFLPDNADCRALAAACGVLPELFGVVVAPTRSLAGNVQIVGRSIETALHKLHDLGMDLHNVVSAMGGCPLAPPAADDLAALGRVNDVMAYGAQVWLAVSGVPVEDLQALLPKVPASTSPVYGRPFLEILKDAGDFYGIDPGYFAPAEITLMDMDSGWTGHAGEGDEERLALLFQPGGPANG